MKFKQLLIFTLLVLSKPLFSQDTTFISSIKIPTFIDTLFIDHDRNNWSVRLFTNYKDNRFQLRNDNQKITYAPNNPIGVGIGLGTRKLILDLAFNIKSEEEEPTERFDFQATLMLENHYIYLTIQSYKGYNVNADGSDYFRDDINSFATTLNYMYVFNASEYSVAAIKSGLSIQKKAAMSTGLGAFLFLNHINADSSIVSLEDYPQSAEELGIVNLQSIGGGLHANVSATVPFLKHLFATASLTPGIGLVYKDVETESGSYFPESPWVYLLDLGAMVGYNGSRVYLNFSLNYAYYSTNLYSGTNILYNRINAKLALGYKLGQRLHSK